MKTSVLRLTLGILALLFSSALNTIADDISTAIDDLKREAVAKIDAEVEINAQAFTDAKNIHRSLVWSDWASPFLDASTAVLATLKTIDSPQTLGALSVTLLDHASTDVSLIALTTSWDKLDQKLQQDGTNLSLAIDGPRYSTAVSAMLERADATTVKLFGIYQEFNPEAYRLTIENDFLGIGGYPSPFVIVHKSTRVDRRGGGTFNSVDNTRVYILNTLSALKTNLAQKNLSSGQQASIIAFLRARGQDLQTSRVGHRRVSYDTFLTTDTGTVQSHTSFSFGTIAELEQWRIAVLDAFAANLTVTINATAKESADTIVSGALYGISQKLEMEGDIAGGKHIKILEDFQSLSVTAYDALSGAGDDVAHSFTFTSDAREQINSLPQQMMDALPGEVTKVVMLVDDSNAFANTISKTPSVPLGPVAPSNLTATAVSASQINLAWQRRSNNETGFKIERRIGSGTWAEIGQSVTAAFSNQSLVANTSYDYRVKAYNAAGNSGYSNTVTAATLGGTPPVRQLTVTSVNPYNGVQLSYTPPALSGPVNGVLSYADVTQVTLTAPATANGNTFLRWEKDGLVYASTQATTLAMDGNHLMSMIFGPPAAVTQYNISTTASTGGTATGAGIYASGQTVTIQATPISGYQFVNWTINASLANGGQIFTTLPSYPFQATQNLNLFANFAANTGGSIAIATSVDPAGTGTTNGAGSYSSGQNAPLTATPVTGWEFGTWTENGTIVSFNSSFSYPVYQAHNYVAHFNPILSQTYFLSITATNGTAIRNPNQVAYSPGTQVTITATPAAGYVFTGWSQDASGTQNPLIVTTDRDKYVTANFSPVPASTYTITLPTRTGGAVSKSPDLPYYSQGTIVTLTAAPNSGYVFGSWRRDTYGNSNPLQVTMDANKLAVADFVPPSPSSTVLVIGTPTSFPVPALAGASGGNNVNNLIVYNQGSGIMYWSASPTVSWLQVNSNVGAGVTGNGGSNGIGFSWADNPTTSPRTGQIYVYAPGAQQNPQIFTITQAAGLPRYSLTVSALNGTVAKTPDQTTYPQGSQVQLKPNPTSGYKFIGWSGTGASGTDDPLTLTMDNDKTVTANFELLPNPDLLPNLALAKTTAHPSESVALSGWVKNRGIGSSRAFKTYYRISNSSTVAPVIGFIGEVPMTDFTGIIEAQQVAVTSSISIPETLAPGNYFVWILTDPEGLAGEVTANRTNNNITLPLTVLPDTVAPQISITAPTSDDHFVTHTATINLAGNATDDVGVTQVTWTNDRNGSGTASGTGNWIINGIFLQPGDNVINVTAHDRAGNVTTDLITVAYQTPDVVAPVVEITFPTTETVFQTSEPQVDLSGTSSDDRAVAQIGWSNDRGGQGVVSGTNIWTTNGITLQPGLNVIAVTATDSSGNAANDALAVTYTPPVPPLPLRLKGEGHITGDAAEGALLTVGQTYTLRAVPGAGEIFGGWSGSIVSENAQLTFTAEEGMEVVANFIANPFAVVSGGYVGLVETEPFVQTMSGSAKVSVTVGGGFSAVLTMGTETVRFAGAFDSQGRFSGQVLRTGKASLQLVLALDLADGSERLTGLVSDGTTTAAINADPALSFAPQRGRYTAVLERDTASTALPAGIGFGTMIVGADGSVRYAGRFGDGTAVALNGYVTARSQWPVYAPLYNGRGALIGRVKFRDIPQTSDLDGRLHWQRPGGSEGDVSLTGSAYARPAVGSRVLGLPRLASNARLTFSDGLLAAPVVRAVTIGAAHQVIPAFGGFFKMTLDAGVGTFSGRIQLDAGVGRVSFGGVLLPKTGVGRGQVFFPNTIGEVELGAP